MPHHEPPTTEKPTPAPAAEPAQPRPAAPQPHQPQQAPAPQSRDPHAQYLKSWLLEIAGCDAIGLDDGDAIVLGRNDNSPFGSWCDENISRNHVELRVRDDVLFAQDLGSTNGTFLNGKRLAQGVPTPCADGDMVQLATEEPIRVEIRR